MVLLYLFENKLPLGGIRKEINFLLKFLSLDITLCYNPTENGLLRTVILMRCVIRREEQSSWWPPPLMLPLLLWCCCSFFNVADPSLMLMNFRGKIDSDFFPVAITKSDTVAAANFGSLLNILGLANFFWRLPNILGGCQIFWDFGQFLGSLDLDHGQDSRTIILLAKAVSRYFQIPFPIKTLDKIQDPQLCLPRLYLEISSHLLRSRTERCQEFSWQAKSRIWNLVQGLDQEKCL